MSVKFAFAGLRHVHITELYRQVMARPDCVVVAVAEEDNAARLAASANWQIMSTHTNIAAMLREVDFDVLAVGDYYAGRGELVIAALRAGKHVIADKPLCTSLKELDEIVALVEHSGLKLGCMRDLRENPNVVAAQNLIATGRLGTIRSICFGGQHPLLNATRPRWYFEIGKHGGTINDIAIHGLDLAERLTGRPIDQLIAARTWNTVIDYPHFNDAAQLMVRLSGGCGVIGDVSYFSPDSQGYRLPFYWRFTVWGSDGVIEFNYNDPGIKAAFNGEAVMNILPGSSANRSYLTDFLSELQGQSGELTTAHVLSIARKTLELQRLADS